MSYTLYKHGVPYREGCLETAHDRDELLTICDGRLWLCSETGVSGAKKSGMLFGASHVKVGE